MNSIMMGAIVALYLRDVTGQMSGIRVQKSMLMDVVRRFNLQVAGEYADVGVSGHDRGKALTDMLSDVSKNGIKYVLVSDVSRFSRRLTNVESIISRLNDQGVHVYSCIQGLISPLEMTCVRAVASVSRS